MLYAPFVGLNFAFFERSKLLLSRHSAIEKGELPFYLHMGLFFPKSLLTISVGSSLSAGVSAFATTPMDVVKTRLQVRH